MNDTGDFYIGKNKINAVTGLSGASGGIGDAASTEKTTYATLTVDDLTVNNNLYSKGNTEVVDLALKGNRAGDIAQTVYVGIRAGDTCPSSATDNILFRTTFTRGGYIGWVRTNEANAGVRWKRWGKISHECTSDHYVFDKIGIGVTYCADQYQFQTVGISTFNGNVFVTGITTHVGNVQVAAGSSFIGAGTIPVGGIIMWSGSIASIPTGWALCNGSSGTPDLRDRFIVGAGNNYSVAGVGGTADSQLPAHTHNVTNGSANSFTAVTSVSDEPVNQGGGGSVNVADQESSTTFTIQSAGISSTNQNLPPYYALAFIMRTV
jgi:microcystin-dependent protein